MGQHHIFGCKYQKLPKCIFFFFVFFEQQQVSEPITGEAHWKRLTEQSKQNRIKTQNQSEMKGGLNLQ